MVRRMLLASLAIFAASAAPAMAGKVTVKTEYYAISGKTGVDLVRAMARKGPRHGFLSKAIAVTRFKPKVSGDMVYKDGVCRTRNAGFDLAITYVYPKPSGKLPADVNRRWGAFVAGVEKHEQTHGRLGRELAGALDRKLRGFSMKDKKGCRAATAAMMADVKKTIVAYDAKQRAFDEKEHRKGGNVEKMLLRLVATK